MIIAITALVSIRAFSNHELFDKLKFNAYSIKHSKEGYRFLSYGLLHADWMHLLINMFVLHSFGKIVMIFFDFHFEAKSFLYFLCLYVGGITLSTIASYIKHKENYYYNAVGASGAVSAVLFSSIILYPKGEIFLMFIPIPISSPIFGLLYLAYSFWMSKKANDNIGHDAHFWGAVFGIIFTIAIRPEFFTNFIDNLF
ncbi:rhomboid family intramembrane serine protease [Bacteroidota bacterium]